MKKYTLTLASIFCFFLLHAQVRNTMTITNVSGVAQTNYPLRFARPFVKGEIAAYPQVLINGSSVNTQADVKQRYPDGSVKHSIISVIIPSIPATGSVVLTFQNQSNGNNTALTKAQMLGANFNFDAIMELTSGGVKKTVSARTMLKNGNFTYWAQGQIASTILLGDNSTKRKYDIGFDTYRPFRPQYEVTFWPAINKVDVRFIGEVSSTQEQEDLLYQLVLKTDSALPQVVYTNDSIPHGSASRWSKEFWIGGAPDSMININHNIKYLTQTPFIPNFDTSIVIQESDIAGLYNTAYPNWLNSPHDIYQKGFWATAMAEAGSRMEIAPLPQWTVMWLYTGDWRLREIALLSADIAAANTAHLREGDSTKSLLPTDKAGTGLGFPFSISDRKSISMSNGFNFGNASDRIIQVGTINPTNTNKWSLDEAHEPDAFSAQYILTGEHWYLEESQFWASWSAAGWTVVSRGPTGAEGGYLTVYGRDESWVLRGRTIADYISPDNDPFRSYLDKIIDDQLAAYEGRENITTGRYYNTPQWKWANQIPEWALNNSRPNPLRFFGQGVTYDNVTVDVVPWMQNFTVYALGRATEMGFKSDALLSWIAPWLIGQITDPHYNPFLTASYYLPKGLGNLPGYYDPLPGQTYFQTWAQVLTELDTLDAHGQWNQPLSNFNGQFPGYSITDFQGGYGTIARAATSFLASETGGANAWNWMYTNAYLPQQSNFHTGPQWDLLPRSIGSFTTSVPNLNTPLITLGQNYPNPFSGSTNIVFTSPEAGKMTLRIFNAMGEIVQEQLVNANTGTNLITLSSENLASGIYLYSLSDGKSGITHRMAIMK